MLFKVNGEEIKELYHKSEYNKVIAKLTAQEIVDIEKELEKIITAKLGSDEEKVFTSSWVPGKDWSGTVYHPIYTKGTAYNEEQAGKIFGLFFMKAFIENDNEWFFFKPNSDEMRGSYYFLKEDI